MIIGKLFRAIFGTKFDRDRRRLQPLVDRINRIEEEYQSLSAAQLRAKTDEFRARIRRATEEAAGRLGAIEAALAEKPPEREEERLRGERAAALGALRSLEKKALDELLPEAFAAVKNACRRLLGKSLDVCGRPVVWEMLPFDVQIIGGIVLHQGKIAEMATGEGKTLVATMPLYLNALTGKNVQLVTVNDYLARRDREWMGPIYESLGLSVGCIQTGMEPSERREAYACDITYGTNNEFGFDYLRDNMARAADEQVQRKYVYHNPAVNEIKRGHYYAIIDEVDSILIDEARTPLIISGPVQVSTHQFRQIMPRLRDLYQKQTLLCGRLVKEGRELWEKGDQEEALRRFYKVKKGAPKNRQLASLLEDIEIRKGLEKAEVDLDASSVQAPRAEEGRALREELFFTITERNHEVDITERGHQALSPADPEEFVLPDLSTAIVEIENDERLGPEEKRRRIALLNEEINVKSEKISNALTSLRALSLYEKDVEYVIQENRVIIVDTFTGRLMPGRRYSDGLHEALEAKEGVEIQRESQTLASVTIQNYFRMYEKLSGMTGTAATEALEFKKIYKLDVVVIPTNRPVVRKDQHDRIYKTRNEKFQAVIEEIADCFGRGQPVLVGTVSVDTSEVVSRLLKRRKIPHQVLNARYHQQEAEIVARAGQKGSVTIATNMAGRGTDIKLGAGIVELGGLHIIGTERHEARRIDNQLRGRAGRQGDPGSSRFYLSLEDDLMRLFGSDRISSVMARMGLEEGEEMTHPLLTRAIETAQKRVESNNFSMREHILKYDDVMNRQREEIYAFRNSIIDSAHPRRGILAMIEDVLAAKIPLYAPDGVAVEEWQWREMTAWLTNTFPIHFNAAAWRSEPAMSREVLSGRLMEIIARVYDLKEQYESPEIMRQLEKMVVLGSIDRLWQKHLYAMDDLRQGISLRAYGQQDPLLEYKKESFNMFSEMEENLKNEVVASIFRTTVRAAFTPASGRMIHDSVRAFDGSAAAPPRRSRPPASPPPGEFLPGMSPPGMPPFPPEPEAARAPVVRQAAKVGPNEPCPCGSGKKFKKCCGRG